MDRSTLILRKYGELKWKIKWIFPKEKKAYLKNITFLAIWISSMMFLHPIGMHVQAKLIAH